MRRQASFHGRGNRYRTRLQRAWASGAGSLAVVGLNPSTADASVDDPTIRRCIGFARTWGFASLTVVNLFDYRATDPRRLKQVRVPCSRLNDAEILATCQGASRIVVAWGNHGRHRGRADVVTDLLMKEGLPLHCFGLTRQQQPVHPLYQRSDAVLVRFRAVPERVDRERPEVRTMQATAGQADIDWTEQRGFSTASPGGGGGER